MRSLIFLVLFFFIVPSNACETDKVAKAKACCEQVKGFGEEIFKLEKDYNYAEGLYDSSKTTAKSLRNMNDFWRAGGVEETARGFAKEMRDIKSKIRLLESKRTRSENCVNKASADTDYICS